MCWHRDELQYEGDPYTVVSHRPANPYRVAALLLRQERSRLFPPFLPFPPLPPFPVTTASRP
jgi:hypothetical protein